MKFHDREVAPLPDIKRTPNDEHDCRDCYEDRDESPQSFIYEPPAGQNYLLRFFNRFSTCMTWSLRM